MNKFEIHKWAAHKKDNYFKSKLGLQKIPNTEIGCAIVDYDGSSRTEEIVVRLTLNFRNERHSLLANRGGSGSSRGIVRGLLFALLSGTQL